MFLFLPPMIGMGGKDDSEDRDSITGDRNESRVPGAGTITYDVRFRAYVPGEGETCTIKLLVNVEAQRLFYQKYRIVTRGIFYGARMLSEQLDREFTASEYDGLRKVYSIWICMNAPNHIGNAMAEYRITKLDRIGIIPEPRESYDKLSVVIICLNDKAEDMQIGKLHGFLNTLLSTELGADEKEKLLANEYGMKIEEEIGEELRRMCNLSEAIEERGIEKGIVQGIEQGIEQGILLTKRIFSLMKEGYGAEEIAEKCNICADRVHEIIED